MTYRPFIYGSKRNLSGKVLKQVRNSSDYYFGRYHPKTEGARKSCFGNKRISKNVHISRTVRTAPTFFCRNRLSMRSLRGSGFFDPERYLSDRKNFHFQKMRGVLFMRMCTYFDLFALPLPLRRNNMIYINILYMDRTEIYRGTRS